MYIGKPCNIVRQLLLSEIITIEYIKSWYNVSDPLTKDIVRETADRSYEGITTTNMIYSYEIISYNTKFVTIYSLLVTKIIFCT